MKQYSQKNIIEFSKVRFTAIRFTKDGHRLFTYGGINAFEVVEFLTENNESIVLLFNEDDLQKSNDPQVRLGTHRRIEAYNEYTIKRFRFNIDRLLKLLKGANNEAI